MKIFIPSIISFLLLIGCNNSHSPNEKASSADSTAVSGFSSKAAENDETDSIHQFIRTADLKFKTADVIRATYEIESMVGQQAGYITYTHLNSEENSTIRTPISEDSSIVTTLYTVRNTMTIRVPNTRLDSFLKALSNEVDYLDYRTIKADDISGQLLSNSLEQKRWQSHQQRLIAAVNNRGVRLNDIQQTENSILESQTDADHSALSTYSLSDQVHYSTVQLEIYQNQSIKNERLANVKYPVTYKAGFAKGAKDALKKGFDYLEDLLVFLLQFWVLILIAPVGYYLHKKYGNRTTK